MEVTITTENFESYKNGSLPLVVDLWATWCGPCRMLAPIVSELASEYDGKIVVGKCDVEENEDIAMEFGVRNIPTLLFFKDGKLVDKFVGSAKKPALVEKSQPTGKQTPLHSTVTLSSLLPSVFFCHLLHFFLALCHMRKQKKSHGKQQIVYGNFYCGWFSGNQQRMRQTRCDRTNFFITA